MKALKRTISEQKFDRVWCDSYAHGRLGYSSDYKSVNVATHGNHVYLAVTDIIDRVTNEVQITCYRYEKDHFDKLVKRAMRLKAVFSPNSLDHTASMTTLWSML
jgi:hypothetical protein